MFLRRLMRLFCWIGLHDYHVVSEGCSVGPHGVCGYETSECSRCKDNETFWYS